MTVTINRTTYMKCLDVGGVMMTWVTFESGGPSVAHNLILFPCEYPELEEVLVETISHRA